MARNTCISVPAAPNGENSKMYNQLLKRINDRPQVNYIYSMYVASNTAQAMEQAGYTKNRQGEYNALDLLKFLNYSSIEREMKDIDTEAQKYDIIDSSGKMIDYTNAKEALDKADDFNDNHNGLVATVYQHGDIYNIHVSEKNANTHMQPTEVKEKLAIWDVYKHAFNSIGVDIENLPQELNSIFNANNVDIARTLRSIKNTSFNFLLPKDALALFYMDPNSAPVQRLVQSFGSIEEAANAIGNLRNGQSYPSSQINLLKRAVNHCQQFQGLDLAALQSQVAQMSAQVKSASPEETIRQEYQKLKRKYKIGINELNLNKKSIESLSQAAGEAVLQLTRRIREIEKTTTNNAEGKRLEGIVDQLMKELEYKRYYFGITNFLKEAQRGQYEIERILANLTPQTGTELEKRFAEAKALMDIKQYNEQYYPIIDALADDKLVIDESISQFDIDNMRQEAKKLKEYFDNETKVINKKAEAVMEGLLMEILGDTAPNGQSIANLVKMAQKDTSIMDYLYSVGRSSNPVIAAMGSIIREAQNSRDLTMNSIAKRIRRATNKLHKAGYDSDFMYEPDEEHLISDIDWKSYKAAFNAQRKALARQGLKGFDLKMALNTWEEANTEDRVVDTKSGRTERVPNAQYRKPFPQLSQAQLDYYNEMMQLKGEIGTLLPAYAQNQYLAPQLRRGMIDAIRGAENAQDVLKAIKNKAENFYKVREDDTNYVGNGIIEGEEYNYAYGSFDNKRLREIPIFYVNKVEQGELLKDFSTGLQHLASTAINYDAMSNVAQVVEFIGDYAKAMASREDVNEADVVENQFMRVSKGLYAWGQNTNTAALIEGYLSQHLYGEKRDPSESKVLQKVFDNIIGYTSFKGLATNLKGAFSNYLVGEFQMLIEAGAGEFYNFKDYAWAHSKLFGTAGAAGEIMYLLTDDMNHKGPLFAELFDPIQENFKDKSHQRYHRNWFRRLVGHDCSFIGYGSGEYLIHYVNMYAVLNNQKVFKNGKQISLYDAFSVQSKQDGNSDLVLDPDVTIGEKRGNVWVDTGRPVDEAFIQEIKGKIKYVNQTTHGSMNEEDKGLIHRKWWGRSVMNFRQWMVEHYSRRFRKNHFDASLGENREGYWYSYFKYLFNEDTKEDWKSGAKGKAKVIGETLGESVAIALPWFVRDYMTFMLRGQAQWDNLTDVQKNNIRRVNSEMMMYIALMGLSFALGEPDKHKKEWWRRWWIYQTRRLILDTEASMPHPKALSNIFTIMQSPVAGVNTLNGLLYMFTGLFSGDLIGENNTIKSGKHKGENRYWRNIWKYNLPVFKDIEQMQSMDEDESIFQVFKTTPTNR